MELRHLRYFVAVAEELHFGRAAQRLFMAQPPLSQQIQQLEKEIGVILFARTNRRVQLTPAGDVFLAETRAILARVDAAVLRTQRTGRGEVGWLGVGFVASSTYDVLPDILRTFRERYPDVELELVEMLGNEQETALRERRIHVGFSRLPSLSEGMVHEPVVEEDLILAVPASHPLAKHTEILLADLSQEPFVLFPHLAQSSYAAYMIRICQEAGFSPRVVQETGEMQTAVSLVAAGIGVAIVPESVRNLMRTGVVYRPMVAPSPRIELTMVYSKNDISPVLPRFLKTVRDVVCEREARS
jgi:DNA-binding transcriptional LysR family regulator